MVENEALRSATMQSKAWPYEEARKLLKRWPDGKPDGAPILFETGYGPSGLPHIGTFNENYNRLHPHTHRPLMLMPSDVCMFIPAGAAGVGDQICSYGEPVRL